MKSFANKLFKSRNKKNRIKDTKIEVLSIFMQDQFKKILRFGEMPISLYTK